LKNIILFLSVTILLVFQILYVEATNSTKYIIQPCENITLPECPEKTIIKEQYDKQISNLNNTIAELNGNITSYKNAETGNTTWKNIGVGFGIAGSIVGIVGGIYGIKKKIQVSNSQLKTEQFKRSAYRSTKKAKDAEKNKHNIESGKKLWDWFTGK